MIDFLIKHYNLFLKKNFEEKKNNEQSESIFKWWEMIDNFVSVFPSFLPTTEELKQWTPTPQCVNVVANVCVCA